jgi:hypothetical protein
MHRFIPILGKAFIILMLIGTASMAATSTEKKTPLQSSTSSSSSTSVADPQSSMRDITIEGLRAQNELLKSFDQRLIATVYWAFGFLGTIAVALFVFGWWTNARINEREFRALSSEIRNQYLEETATLRKEIASTLSDQIDTRVKNILETEVTPSIRKLDAAFGHASDEIADIAFERAIERAKSAIAEGVFSNGVSYYSEAARYAMRKSDIFNLQTGLAGILAAFRASKEAGKRIDIGRLNRIELAKVLDKAPKEVTDLVDAIRAALKDAAAS